ncbi:hypothetical protein J6590_091856 [Homalodisca vitripennis]|nr:hypothetical protein J6590_064747 [Homalodisca vitripennis]KAG8329205.1 hypothetical protein J6590_091856 [Homalodisca vitripennis]
MVAMGAVVVLAILGALAMPLFGFQYCQLLGTCNNSLYTGYNNMYQNDVYGQYPSSSYQSGNTYQKRSVDYMGPMLHMLKAAYDKYGQNGAPSLSKKDI